MNVGQLGSKKTVVFSSGATMNQADAVKCTVVGRVETVDNNRQFVFDLDRTVLPFGISGQDINPPLDRTYTNLDKSKLMSTSYFNGGVGAAIPQ